jgi:hypothetical protein
VKSVAVVIDKWKLAIFERHLTAAGFTWVQHEGPVGETWLLKVETDEVDRLAGVSRAANTEAAMSKAS